MPTLQDRIDAFFADPLADIDAQRQALDALLPAPVTKRQPADTGELLEDMALLGLDLL